MNRANRTSLVDASSFSTGANCAADAAKSLHRFARERGFINDIFRAAATSSRKICDAYYDAAEFVYLQHHARLPGGTRNVRLRKKRRDKVLRWMAKHIDKGKPNGYT